MLLGDQSYDDDDFSDYETRVLTVCDEDDDTTLAPGYRLDRAHFERLRRLRSPRPRRFRQPEPFWRNDAGCRQGEIVIPTGHREVGGGPDLVTVLDKIDELFGRQRSDGPNRLTRTEHGVARIMVKRIIEGGDQFTERQWAKITSSSPSTVGRVKAVLRGFGLLYWVSRHTIVPGGRVPALNAACRYFVTFPETFGTPVRPWLSRLERRVVDRIGRTPRSRAVAARLAVEVSESQRLCEQFRAEWDVRNAEAVIRAAAYGLVPNDTATGDERTWVSRPAASEPPCRQAERTISEALQRATPAAKKFLESADPTVSLEEAASVVRQLAAIGVGKPADDG